MAIVVYKCDVCKREAELQRNITGLERIHRCTITLGCRGKLYQIKNLPDYTRGIVPPEVVGLDDWQQRRVLYNHTQTIARSVWHIRHNLGTNPSVFVYINRPLQNDLNNQEEIIPTSITIIDRNTIELKFDTAWSGVAQLVARQTDSELLNPAPIVEPIVTNAYQQITKSGELTLATSISTYGEPTNIYITGVFTDTLGRKHEKVFTADSSPAIASPWSDTSRIMVKGRNYTVRSFNLINPSITPEIIQGIIGSGSTLEITGVSLDGTPSTAKPAVGDLLILLASDPYETFDKVTTKFVDVANTSSNTLFFNAPEFYTVTAAIQNTYPPIRVV